MCHYKKALQALDLRTMPIGADLEDFIHNVD